jgi:hypothetical protein
MFICVFLMVQTIDRLQTGMKEGYKTFPKSASNQHIVADHPHDCCDRGLIERMHSISSCIVSAHDEFREFPDTFESNFRAHRQHFLILTIFDVRMQGRYTVIHAFHAFCL